MVVQMPAPSRTLDDIRARMLELTSAAGIACRMMHETAPVTARRMSLGSSSKKAESSVQVRPPLPSPGLAFFPSASRAAPSQAVEQQETRQGVHGGLGVNT
jgi:hypothetical protein